MCKQGLIPAHGKKGLCDQGRTAEDKGIDPSKIRGYFPKSHKQDKKKYPCSKDDVFSFFAVQDIVSVVWKFQAFSLSSFHMMLKYFLKSGAFLEERGVRSLISRSISMIFRTVAGRAERISTRSAMLMASEIS